MNRVFLISTMGQARNALAIAKHLNNSDIKNLFVLVFTQNTPQVVSARDFLKSSKVSLMEIALPSMPNSGIPFVVRSVFSLYINGLKIEEMKELWIANINSHYALIAGYCQKTNVDICFYEDGLGSYKNLHEMNLTKSSKLIFAELGRGIFGELKKISKRLGKTIRRIFVITRIAFFSFRWVRWLCGFIMPAPLHFYYRLHQNFKKVYVSFPNRIDSNLFKGDYVEFNYLEKTRDATKRDAVFNLTFDTKPKVSGSLFISQVYGSGSEKWYSTVSLVLTRHEKKRIYVKFHPKEGFEKRRYFVKELKRFAAEVIDIDLQNHLDANDVIAKFSFSKILGITSSSLVYALKSPDKVEVQSIAPDILLELSKDPSLAVERHQLKKDFEIISRFLAK